MIKKTAPVAKTAQTEKIGGAGEADETAPEADNGVAAVAAPVRNDVFDAAKRSEIMSKVRSTKNKSTELRLIDEFKARKITGWRRNSKIFGHPDFIFPKLRIAVFVDGCFWHGHDCRNTKPKDRADYWTAKIERNRRRDQAATERLRELGYVVVRIWECDFKKTNKERLEEKLRPIIDAFEASRAAAVDEKTIK